MGASPNPVKLAKKALKIGKQADKRSRKALKTGRTANKRSLKALRILAGPVPNAARAETAGVADSLKGVQIGRFNTRVAPSATASPSTAARAAAQRVPLFAAGPITVYGKCYVDSTTAGNPFVSGELFIETSAEGVIYSADDSSTNNGFLSPSTPETNRELLSGGSAAGIGNPGTLNLTDADAGAFHAIAPGIAMQGQLTVGTKVGSPPAGDGVFGPGNACIFSGAVNAG